MTLVITGGSLNISAPASIDFGSAGSPSTKTVLMTTVTVTDQRGAGPDAAWTASAIATALTPPSGPTIAASAIGYTSGTLAVTGTVTPTENDQINLTGEVAVVSALRVSGDNTVSWTPTITVKIPTGLAHGTYTGYITQSVA